MKNPFIRIPIGFVFALSLSLALLDSLTAEPQAPRKGGVQSGEITFEEEEKKKDPYQTEQDAAIAFFREMEGRVKEAQKSGSTTPATLSEGALHYLTGAYLYCSSRAGTCPLILEAVLEADIMNARINANSDCPMMKRFWTIWVRNGMEKTLGYLTKTGYMDTVTEFNTKVRPAFIRCEDTVKEKTRGATSNQVFFKERYAPDNRPAQLATKMVSLLSGLKQQINNVFYATGVMSAPPAAAAGSQGTKR